MAFMRVSLVEPLCQVVMGKILTLEYMLSGAHGLLRPHPIVPSAKCHRFSRPLVLVMPICCRKPPGVLTGCLSLASGRGGSRDGQTGGEILPTHVYHKEEE
jgi:hypothetical protein